jgi:glucose-6-phosphate isomerase
MFKLHIDNILDFISWEEIKSHESEAREKNDLLYNHSGVGSDFLGWLDLPSRTLGVEEGLSKIKECSKSLSDISDIVVVIGIGGSYLGARAVIDALSNNFAALKSKKKHPKILYAGQNIGEDYMLDLLNVLREKEFSLIVISKSGTTTEPAIAFRILKRALEKKYGAKKSRKRIIAITDSSKGALKKLADENGYRSFVIPDDIGGRYSVLTSVGLLPIAAAGYNISELVEGARNMEEILKTKTTLETNQADLYAVVRNLLYRKGKSIEILTSFTPAMQYFIEWWKQLFGESEGKDNKGIFPAGVNFTTDLHSMGQWIQEGTRNIFETFLFVENTHDKITIPEDSANADELNYLAGKSINDVNRSACEATMHAHKDGGVPNMLISIDKLDEENLGELIYFFEKACAVSGYMLGVNPFNQPGVEAYKNNMFKLLGKPGYK